MHPGNTGLPGEFNEPRAGVPEPEEVASADNFEEAIHDTGYAEEERGSAEVHEEVAHAAGSLAHGAYTADITDVDTPTVAFTPTNVVTASTYEETDDYHELPDDPEAPDIPAHAPQEVTPPADHREVQEVAETAPDERMQHVARLAKIDGKVVNRPELGKITNAARDGELQQIVITKGESGKPIRVEASESLVPRDALPAPAASDETRAANEADEPQLRFWARIIPERPLLDPQQQPAQPGAAAEQNGLQLEAIAAKFTGAFKLIIQGQGIPDSAREAMAEDTSNNLKVAAATRGMGKLAKELYTLNDVLTEAEQTALMSRTVVVGARTQEELDQLVPLVAGEGFTSDETTTWTLERDRDGHILSYDDAATAQLVSAAQNDSLISAKQFHSEVRWPEINLNGIETYEREFFAATYEVPEGAPRIVVGETYDNAGNVSGELALTVDDFLRHSLVIASSGAGKTHMLRRMACGVVQEGYTAYLAECKAALERGEAPPKPRGVVIFDFEKSGEYTDELAAQLRGMGLPEEWATVNRIAPGAEDGGLRANINLLRCPPGTNPLSQTEAAVKLLSGNIHHVEAERVFLKFSEMAIRRAYEKCGWDMKDGISLYPNDPPYPDMEMVRVALDEIMSESDYKAETSGDIKGFTKGQFDTLMQGMPSQLFQGGYDIDWEAVRSTPGITVVELGRIKNMDVRRIAAASMFQGLGSVMEAERAGKGNTNKLGLAVIMDETGGIFDSDTAMGKENARRFAVMRGFGVGIVIAQQGRLEQIDTNVLDNTRNVFNLQSNNPATRKFIAERMNIPDAAKYTSTLSSGQGLFIGRGMNTPVRFSTPPPERIGRERGTVNNDPLPILIRDGDSKFYPSRVHTLAGRFLDEHPEVVAISELTTAMTVDGCQSKDLPRFHGPLKEELRNMRGLQADVRDAAIEAIVKLSVTSRPQILNAMTHLELRRFVSEFLLAQVDPERSYPVKLAFTMQLNTGHFTAVKNVIIDARTARRHPETPAFQGPLGSPLFGRTADEQWDVAVRLEKLSVKAVKDALTAASLTPEMRVAALTHMERLMGSSYDPNNPAHASHLARLQERILGRLGTQATEGATALYSEFVTQSTANLQARNSNERLGYNDFFDKLRTHIATANNTGPIDLSKLQMRYQRLIDQETGYTGRPDQPRMIVDFSGDSATQQWEKVLGYEKKYITSIAQRYPVPPERNDLLFSPDYREGEKGYALDKVVIKLLMAERAGGQIFRDQERHYGEGAQAMPIIRLLADNPAEAERWANFFGARLIMGPNIQLTVPAAQAVRQWVAGVYNKLKERANEKRTKPKAGAAA